MLNSYEKIAIDDDEFYFLLRIYFMVYVMICDIILVIKSCYVQLHLKLYFYYDWILESYS